MNANMLKARRADVLHIRPETNTLYVAGDLTIWTFRRLFAALHDLIVNRGYQDIVLDFSGLEKVYPGGALPLCAHIRELRRNRIDTQIKLPSRDLLRKLFCNANWAHLMEPRAFDKNARPGSRVPAIAYSDAEELSAAIDAILRSLLSAMQLRREDFAAAEWALAEIADNVLQHADSPDGGLVQLGYHGTGVEFTVSDCGQGIPNTLRAGRNSSLDDRAALEMCIKEGVTRDTVNNQGNGLFGTFEVCRVSKGMFWIQSGNAHLSLDRSGAVTYRNEAIPYKGTTVDAYIDLSTPGILKEALRFSGRVHSPPDLIELRYEMDHDAYVPFPILDFAQSFISRDAARRLRTTLVNFSAMVPDKKIVIDFTGAPIISSSFADEVFGKLFVEFGPMKFHRIFEFRNLSDVSESLIDRAMRLRFASSGEAS